LTLGVATSVYRIDKKLAAFAMRSAGRSFSIFLLLVILITAFLSMWLSNIAAAALILACLRPILREFQEDHMLRRTLLIGVALGADLGGIATPIGTGPNAIAIASIAPAFHISFLDWMIFAFPLTVGMLGIGYAMLLIRSRPSTQHWSARKGVSTNDPATQIEENQPAKGQWFFLGIVATTITLWLTEPIHNISSPVVAIGAAAVLFLSGLLKKKDLFKIDWSTLMLIAGGITLGRLLEQSGLIKEISAAVPFSELNLTMALFLICLASAVLSAVMSNTATVVLLIPLATAVIPAPSTAILVAVSASFGLPFVISTPQNAMAYGEGGLKFNDLFTPGMILMIVGCAIVSLTGRDVLNFVGIP
jgi:solute carrier family 13 (sodium-dependent dicarboxylate transporter), member 2/3/5